jgi:hypothetical protein
MRGHLYSHRQLLSRSCTEEDNATIDIDTCNDLHRAAADVQTAYRELDPITVPDQG